MRTSSWGVIGVPSSAGAHTPGIEQAPAALRAAGLLDVLGRGKAEVVDHGDVPGFRWRPDPVHPHGQNGAEVARVARDTGEAVATILAAGQTPLVLGGDCSITVGAVAGMLRTGPAALLYMDGGPDLFTPQTRAVGNLDAMGVAHLLAIPGHVPEVAAVGEVVPLLTPDRVVSFGDALPEDDHERRLLDQLGIARIAVDEVHRDPAAAAAHALALVEQAAPAFLLHVDVDVLAFVDAPIADVPNSGGEPIGLRLDEALVCLDVFVRSPRCAGMVLTEVNPDHVPEPEVLRSFAARVAGVLARATG